MAPVITLLTDFGTSDPYVGMMKGVIAGICPAATVIDLTHDVPPQDIRTGAFFLERSFRYFPRGTTHVAVVDPGVGTARKPIAVRAEGQCFVGPDNGVLGHAARRARAVVLDRARYFRPDVSNTFHGRDIFAPVAAHLACGTALEDLGTRLARIVRLPAEKPRRAGGKMRGTVVSVDRFGNLITNLDQSHWRQIPRARLKIGAFLTARVESSYQTVKPGALAAILGGYGLIEIAARDGSAAKMLGLGSGSLVELLPR